MRIENLLPYFGRAITKFIFTPLFTRKVVRELKPNEAWVLAKIRSALQLSAAEAQRVYRRGIGSEINFQLDYAWIAQAKKKRILAELARTRIEHLGRVQQVMQTGRPVILLSIHMGSFYFGFLKLAMEVQAEREINIVKMASANSQEDSLHRLIEEKFGAVKVLRFDDDVGKNAYLALRRGGIVAMMSDVEVRVPSREKVPFFGQDCFMQSGVARLALTTRAIILPVINFETASGERVIRIEQPLFPEPAHRGENNQQVVARLMQQIASLFETWVQIDPQQFQRWTDLAWTMYQHADAKEPVKAAS